MYEQQALNRAEGQSYTDIMVRKLDELTEIFQEYYSTKAKLHWDSHLLSDLISVELVILSHLLPKMKGSGEKAKALYLKLEEFRPWLRDVTIPQIRESHRVTEVFDLILQSYDLLGLSHL